MTPEQRRQTTRIFQSLEYGEQLATRCALHQSTLVKTTKESKFLRAQARQERFHAFFYHQAAKWLSPKCRKSIPPSLIQFGQYLDDAMQRNDLVECLVGSQIVLEGFGGQILIRLNRGLDNHNIGLKRQRQMILRQEQNHRAFGIKTLGNEIKQERAHIETVFRLSDKYVELTRDITEE